jgi:hypothetical protein
MSTMPTNDDKPLGGLGGIFSAQYLPAAMIAFTSGLKAMGLKGQGDALVTAAGRRQQAADFEAQQLEVNAGQAKAASQRDAFFKDSTSSARPWLGARTTCRRRSTAAMRRRG